jgi:copper(I)-binding protein
MTPTPLRRPVRLLAAVALAAVPLAACGDDDEATTTTTEAPATSEAAGPAIELEGAWARPSPAMATAGAVYVEITNRGDVDDALVGVAVDASVAAKAELHESTAAEPTDDTMDDEGMGEGSGTTMGGMMGMRPVDEIPVPAGGSVSLEPGGYHIMLLELAAPLEMGTTIEVVLTFAEAGELVLEAEVRDSAP